jgi:hypothetical protein
MTMDRTGSFGYRAVLLLALVACSTEQPSGRKDTVVPADSLPRGTPPPADLLAAVWDTAAGTYFAVSGETPAQAFLVYPGFTAPQRLDTLHVDSASVHGLELELFAEADSGARVRVAGLEPDTVSDCVSWPAMRVVLVDGQPPARRWTVGFPPGRVTVTPFDSLPALSRSDSTRLTIAVARAASKVEGDTAVAFRGRPFVVRQANRFRIDPGREGILAEVVRVVTQEANPLQEQLLLILEADSAGIRSALAPAFARRQIGLEEALESVELTAVVRFRNGTWSVLLHRELGEGSRFELLTRERPGRWILRWRSAYAGC